MRAVARYLAVTLLAISCTTPTKVREPEWNELMTRSEVLYQQARYAEALKVAEEALNVAEKTFGTTHPFFASSLNNLAVLIQDRRPFPTRSYLTCRELPSRLNTNFCTLRNPTK